MKSDESNKSIPGVPPDPMNFYEIELTGGHAVQDYKPWKILRIEDLKGGQWVCCFTMDMKSLNAKHAGHPLPNKFFIYARPIRIPTWVLLLLDHRGQLRMA